MVLLAELMPPGGQAGRWEQGGGGGRGGGMRGG